MMDWLEKISQQDENQKEVLCFSKYIEVVSKNPFRELRPTFKYLNDMIHYFGKDEEGHFILFQTDHPGAPAVYGQFKTQEELIKNFTNFDEEGFNDKFILLVGPNGSSKSSIVKKIIKGAEEYSKKEEGSLYSFSWVFPIDNFVKGTLGLTSEKESSDLDTYAYLEDNEITAILGSELKDHPILLIPVKHRQDVIEELLKDNQDYLESIQRSYLYTGDLSKKNRMIYDALLKSYKGDHKRVLKHIRVERFQISKRYSTGAVTIEPQMHVDARLQQITMDKRLASLPPSLQSLNLFSMQGEAVLANRGILEYSDLLKRPLDAYKYLLMTMETRSINIQGILTELDIFFVGTSNELHLAAFKQHPDFNSFKVRFNFVKVPYLLDYTEEEKIYLAQAYGLKDKTKFEPLALQCLCLFAALTRLRCPQAKHYTDQNLSKIVVTLNPLEKALFISDKITPARLKMEERQLLQNSYNIIIEEFMNESLYEGKFGISPRDIKSLIYEMAAEYKNITFIEVLEYLQKVILKKEHYDFLNMNPQSDFHHPARFLALLKEHHYNLVDEQLRESLGMIDNRSYEDYLKRYVTNVTAHIKGEKIKNTTTGKFEVSDTYFIKEFEANIKLSENAEKFRSQILSKLGAYALDNPGKTITYSEVFLDLVKKLKETFRNEQRNVLQNISKNLVFFQSDKTKESKSISEANKKQIETVLENLQENFSYSRTGALTIVRNVINERYQ